MASYDYKCGDCGEFEVNQSMKDPVYVECPRCGCKEIERLIRGVGIHYKGSGFYTTDYKKMDGAFNKYLPRTEDKKVY